MKTAQQIVACLFLLALAMKEGLSIECYSCNSFSNEDCAVIGEKTNKVTCSANQTMCRKVEQQIYYNKADHIRVFRQCATHGTPGSCDSRTGTYRFKSWYCHCNNKGLCNDSGSLFAPVLLTLIVVFGGLSLCKL